MKKSRGVQINRTRILPQFVLPAAGLLLVVILGLCFYFRPRPAWIVDDSFVMAWQKVLAASESPLLKAKIIPLSVAGNKQSSLLYGYQITATNENQVSGNNESMVNVYRRLAGSVQQGEALLLAVDPWMVFRKFTTSPLSREQAENGAGEKGLILLAGSDTAAVRAWSAQLMQESPGVFSRNEELWEQTEGQIPIDRRFQRGALTYSWEGLWPHLLNDDETVWVYAPLSRIRELPVHQTNILEADVFPGRPGWTEFGLQAEILRAIPYGSQKNLKKLEPVKDWLTSVPLQTLASDTFGRLAAHPEAPPYNPVSGAARIAWLTSSYVWEIPERENN